MPRTRVSSPPAKPGIPEVGAPSHRPHAEQKLRWSAVSCAQCWQVRIAVEQVIPYLKERIG